ncbi:chemotaxis protein CheW [Paenibacillus sp. GCM10012307]|uniref:Purine-binding chemotaxis protein CheW n=1 Tax=Paenibacillus roseus TaxID=2798579 RepID=A0A934IZ09_9BACL|nr:chemotaxis protein CheW [Paenibacillus roseus]MBJ6360284.1 purine-binding chemotaxis protein CheW [Paenibacillus roseus]
MSGSEQNQYVEFGMGSESYAILISDIHEIIRMQAITEIPDGPLYMKGVINLRGNIVPVISLRNLFMMEEAPYGKTTRIIVIKHREDALGIIVDRVNKVVRFQDIQTPLLQGGEMYGARISGIGIGPDMLVGILKLDELLTGRYHFS